MSLFGGDGAVPEYSSNDLIQPSSSQTAPPQATQYTGEEPSAQEVSYINYDTQDDDGALNDNPDNESEEDPAQPISIKSRPNRWTGKASTWRGYTSAERNIAASLDQKQAADLSAHLYNAHALKRHVRLPPEQLKHVREWQTKDAWMRKGAALEYVDILGETQTELVPSKRWTAWPLPPEEVPGPVGKDAVGEVVETAKEEVLACFLRVAKERFKEREKEDDEPKRKKRKVQKEETKRSKSVTSERSETEAEEEVVDSESQVLEGGEAKWANILKPVQKTLELRAVVSADDEAARKILEATINSLLTRIDLLAAGVRRTRKNHFGRGAYSETSGSEATSGAETDRSASRSRSRSTSAPRGCSAKALPSRAAPRTSRPSENTTKALLKSKRPSHDSDSASEFSADDLSNGTGVESNTSLSPRRRRSASVSSATHENSAQVGLLDWSEVLGIASLTSAFPSAAITRAAQRCATLFDEGMAFRNFAEDTATYPIPEPVEYLPSTIPPPNLDVFSSSASPVSAKRPFFDVGTLSCPHPDCKYHKEVFNIPYRVVEHVIRRHGYDPRTNNSTNEEQKYGGVHMDGFLMPITAKQGWLGRGSGRSKSKSTSRPVPRRRTRKAKSEDVDVGSTGVEAARVDESAETHVGKVDQSPPPESKQPKRTISVPAVSSEASGKRELASEDDEKHHAAALD